mmetsp:Transcript_76293/g.149656  ORF Transcript_76293/g.149656 Transcript_76293/m.149656 type:complete len:208 (+) Transcript_76293:386-1009(+)
MQAVPMGRLSVEAFAHRLACMAEATTPSSKRNMDKNCKASRDRHSGEDRVFGSGRALHVALEESVPITALGLEPMQLHRQSRRAPRCLFSEDHAHRLTQVDMSAPDQDQRRVPMIQAIEAAQVLGEALHGRDLPLHPATVVPLFARLRLHPSLIIHACHSRNEGSVIHEVHKAEAHVRLAFKAFPPWHVNKVEALPVDESLEGPSNI